MREGGGLGYRMRGNFESLTEKPSTLRGESEPKNLARGSLIRDTLGGRSRSPAAAAARSAAVAKASAAASRWAIRSAHSGDDGGAVRGNGGGVDPPTGGVGHT